jgi:hypothetical protein
MEGGEVQILNGAQGITIIGTAGLWKLETALLKPLNICVSVLFTYILFIPYRKHSDFPLQNPTCQGFYGK